MTKKYYVSGETAEKILYGPTESLIITSAYEILYVLIFFFNSFFIIRASSFYG